MNLRPFFTYYGGKWRIARRYQTPRHQTIIEPFAGSAGFSVRHHCRDVLLYDLNEKIIGTWQYLIAASADEIRRLPLLEPGQAVSDLPICQEAQWLIGWNLNKGGAAPCRTLSAWATEPRYASQFWGEKVRERIASQVRYIRHWEAEVLDYRNIPDYEDATWFIDPPYQSSAGRHYTHSDINYRSLGDWCKDRLGQVIVCESSGADWLPFSPVIEAKSMKGISSEVAWQCISHSPECEVTV